MKDFPRPTGLRTQPWRWAMSVLLLSLAVAPAPAAPAAEGLGPAVYLSAARAGSRIVVVGERGIIRYSADGVSWNSAQVPVNVTLTSVRFHSPSIGWACGHDQVVLKTEDGGATWRVMHALSEEIKNQVSLQSADPSTNEGSGRSPLFPLTNFFQEGDASAHEQIAPLLDLLVLDERRVIAAGAYGLILRTADAGQTWTKTKVDPREDLHLYGLARTPDGTLWAAGETGVLYQSANGGQTWTSSRPPHRGSFFGVLGFEDGGMVLYGLRGHIAFRARPSAPWRSLTPAPDRTLTCATQLNDDTVLFGGAAGQMILLHLKEGRIEKRRLPVQRNVFALLALDPTNVLVLADEESRIFNVEQDLKIEIPLP